jgi:putative hydrolase of the HAD superfamily
MIKALMLDVDGVLVCGRPKDGLPWATDLFADLGVSPERLQREFFAAHWDDILIGRADLRTRLDPVLHEIAPHVTSDKLIRYWFEQDARVNADIVREIALLRQKGLTIHLCTNQEHVRAHYLMNKLGLAAHVDGIFYSAALGSKKPSPAFFQTIEIRMGLQGPQCLLIDDMPANIAAAHREGWRAVHWTGDASLREISDAFVA